MQAFKLIHRVMYRCWEFKDCDFPALHLHFDFFLKNYRSSPKLVSIQKATRKYESLIVVLFSQNARLEHIKPCFFVIVDGTQYFSWVVRWQIYSSISWTWFSLTAEKLNVWISMRKPCLTYANFRILLASVYMNHSLQWMEMTLFADVAKEDIQIEVEHYET